MSLKDFQIITQLGQGAYSTVFKVKRLIDSQEYALKKVKMNNLTQKQKQNALNQVRILASINHPNVISYKQAFIEKGTNYLCIVMQHADDGDLLAKIKEHTKNKTRFQEEEIWSILIQTLQGLKVLHDMKILHRDIKSANVFLMKNGQVKIGDLNVSKAVKSMCQTQTGTPYYASPEIWKDEPYDKKSDIWSLGCVIYQVIALKPPFRANDMQGLYKKISRGFYTRLPPQYSNDLSIVLKMMLQVAPHLRSTCDKLLEFPIVMKHFVFLPDSILERTQKNSSCNLMRTIKIDEKIQSNELKSKVQLPKARYFLSKSYSEQIPTQNQSQFGKTSRILIHFQKKQSKSRQFVLPPINKTIEHTDTSKIKAQPHSVNKQQKSIIQRILSPSVVSNNRLERFHSIIQKKNPEKQHYMQHKSKEKVTDKRLLYEGRLKQMSPEILHKILKQQKQKEKIKSIIGTY